MLGAILYIINAPARAARAGNTFKIIQFDEEKNNGAALGLGSEQHNICWRTFKCYINHENTIDSARRALSYIVPARACAGNIYIFKFENSINFTKKVIFTPSRACQTKMKLFRFCDLLHQMISIPYWTKLQNCSQISLPNLKPCLCPASLISEPKVGRLGRGIWLQFWNFIQYGMEIIWSNR